MKIGKINFASSIFLAPMAGVADASFRQLCYELGADLTYTEMVSVKALLHNNKKTFKLLDVYDKTPTAVQLFGHNKEDFVKVIQSGIIDKFDIIDINMGCPAPKIVKNGDGSALLKNIDLAREIISACVSATNKPITVKIRTGFELDNNIAVEFAKMCEQAGASAICVHGRTREQFYSGKVDYQTIKNVKKAVNIPVIGNGDIVDIESYKNMLQTGVDGVMIGRGALGNPEIFAILKRKAHPDKLSIIRRHIQLIKEHNAVTPEMKKHLLWYLNGFKNNKNIKIKIVNSNIEDAINLIEEHLKSRKER